MHSKRPRIGFSNGVAGDWYFDDFFEVVDPPNEPFDYRWSVLEKATAPGPTYSNTSGFTPIDIIRIVCDMVAIGSIPSTHPGVSTFTHEKTEETCLDIWDTALFYGFFRIDKGGLALLDFKTSWRDCCEDLYTKVAFGLKIPVALTALTALKSAVCGGRQTPGCPTNDIDGKLWGFDDFFITSIITGDWKSRRTGYFIDSWMMSFATRAPTRLEVRDVCMDFWEYMTSRGILYVDGGLLVMNTYCIQNPQIPWVDNAVEELYNAMGSNNPAVPPPWLGWPAPMASPMSYASWPLATPTPPKPKNDLNMGFDSKSPPPELQLKDDFPTSEPIEPEPEIVPDLPLRFCAKCYFCLSPMPGIPPKDMARVEHRICFVCRKLHFE